MLDWPSFWLGILVAYTPALLALAILLRRAPEANVNQEGN